MTVSYRAKLFPLRNEQISMAAVINAVSVQSVAPVH
jgi:hypothetical protein